MSVPSESRPGVGGAIGRHGPNWIIAIGTLLAAVAAAGFIGHATASPSASAPLPAVTVTTTATVTAPAVVAGGPTSPTDGGQPSTSASPGQLITTYSFHLPGRYGAPLGTTPPTQKQIVASSPYDIIYRSDLGGAPVGPAPGNQMFQLTNGTTPTYQACTTSTNVKNGLTVMTGTVFCVTESSGLIAGVKVSSAHQSGSDWSLDLTVWIWQAV